MQCTEKYQSQVRLKPDGTLDNYKCGQPFANSDLKINDPISGIKAAWNFNWKWMYYGIADYAIPWICSGSHSPASPFPPIRRKNGA
jgi:hypothetical protein